MNTKQQKILSALLLSVLSGTAFAQKHEVVLEPPQVIEKYVYAKVTRVSPVYHYVEQTTPVKECWDEPVSRERVYYGNTGGSTLAGGLIGGIIGHQLGHGRGRSATTALGTIIGAQIGHDAGGYRTYTDHETYRNVCQVIQKDDGFEVVQDGYQVNYEFEGKNYNTHLPYDPGDRIKLKVEVESSL